MKHLYSTPNVTTFYYWSNNVICKGSCATQCKHADFSSTTDLSEKVNTPTEFLKDHCMYFDINGLPEGMTKRYQVLYKKSLVDDGAFVHAGDEIYTFCYWDEAVKKSLDLEIKFHALEDGYVIFSSGYSLLVPGGTAICEIYKSLDDVFERNYKITYEILTDDFTGKKYFKWTNTPPLLNNPLTRCLQNGFDYVDHTPSLKIYASSTDKLLVLMFEDKSLLKFPCADAPLLNKDIRLIPLTENEFNVLNEKRILKARKYYSDDSFHDYITEGLMAHEYLQYCGRVIKGTFAEWGVQWKSEQIAIDCIEGDSAKERCYVYLMIDTTNGYYKIGISNNPHYREHTLQSEKPTIEMLGAKEFPSRLIARSFESALHNAFSSKHVRGEWFCLTNDEARQVIDSLK